MIKIQPFKMTRRTMILGRIRMNWVSSLNSIHFVLITSKNKTYSTDLSTTERKDEIDTKTVHLNDIEFCLFFKCSEDGVKHCLQL
jgi:hypothetical protein